MSHGSAPHGGQGSVRSAPAQSNRRSNNQRLAHFGRAEDQAIRPENLALSSCMKTANIEDLTVRIEQVIQEHIAASHAAAADAMERAFVVGMVGVKEQSGRARPRRKAQSGRRRTPDEMAAAGKRLYETICAKPGETMTVLAADIGMAPQKLQRPLAGLKCAGKVRSVGQRHLTRYFPLVEAAAAAA